MRDSPMNEIVFCPQLHIIFQLFLRRTLVRSVLSCSMILLLVSCDNKTQIHSDKKPLKDYSVAKEIPLTRKGIPVLFYRLSKNVSYQLNLDSLELGFDSLQIRLWLDCSVKSYKRLFVLSNSNNNWSGVEYEYASEWIEKADSERLLSQTNQIITPELGWNKFMDSLNRLDIYNLPDMYSVKGMVPLALDGDYYFLEIANKEKYKFCIYSNLDYYLDKKEWPASNMAKIIDLFSHEFGFDCGTLSK